MLGWDSLLEGRIGKEILSIQEHSMRTQGSQRHIKNWTIDFIHWLLSITHTQWLYRNARTHLCLLEGKTVAEHDSIMEDVKTLLLTEPSKLLPQHRHLLEVDFEKLGAGSSIDRQYWLANLKSAVAAFSSMTALHACTIVHDAPLL